MAVLLAWLAEIGIITWRDVTGKTKNHTIQGLPLPADYLATFAVYGLLGMVPKDNVGAHRAAGLAAWAFVVATYLNVLPETLNPSGQPRATSAKKATSTATTSTTIRQ